MKPPLELLFCENETNIQKLFGGSNANDTAKDGINDYIVNNDKDAVKVVTTESFKNAGRDGEHDSSDGGHVSSFKCTSSVMPALTHFSTLQIMFVNAV